MRRKGTSEIVFTRLERQTPPNLPLALAQRREAREVPQAVGYLLCWRSPKSVMTQIIILPLHSGL